MNRAELGWMIGKLVAGHAVLFASVAWLNLTERARRLSYWRLCAERIEQLSGANSSAR